MKTAITIIVCCIYIIVVDGYNFKINNKTTNTFSDRRSYLLEALWHTIMVFYLLLS